MIDNRQYSIAGLGSVYFLDEDKKALVETGPATSAETVLAGIKAAGGKPEEIAYIIVTHIHLDHAGGAGTLLKSMPKAKLLVHPRGARHMVNPARLIASMLEAQGDSALVRNGEPVPIPEERVQSVNDGDSLRLSEGQELKFIYAPGHAPHQICIYESRNQGLFAADAVSVSLADGAVFLPQHPPPNFDLEQSNTTVRKLMEFKAKAIYYTHFGVSRTVAEDLQLSLDKLQIWHNIAMQAIAEGAFDKMYERFVAQALAELGPIKNSPSLYDYVVNIHLPLVAAGHVKYYEERFRQASQGQP